MVPRSAKVVSSSYSFLRNNCTATRYATSLLVQAPVGVDKEMDKYKEDKEINLGKHVNMSSP